MSARLNGFHPTEPRRGIRPGFPFWSPGGSEGSCDYRADLGDVHHTIPVVWLRGLVRLDYIGHESYPLRIFLKSEDFLLGIGNGPNAP